MTDWFTHTVDWFAHKLLGLPELDSSTGKPIDDLMVYVHWLMLVLLIGWTLYFFYVLWRFNAKRNPKADYDGSKSHLPKYTEIGVVIAEAVLLVVIAMPLWARNVEEFPKPEDSTVIAIMAQQFAWNVRYPGKDGKFGRQDMRLVKQDNLFGVDPTDPNGKDDVQTLNEIHVPLVAGADGQNKPVIIYVSSKDVIHSFKLIAMRVTQDAIPGMRIPLWFQPTQTGKYQINCAQLCGNSHFAMNGGVLTVESRAEFEKWLASKAGAATSFE